MKHTKKTLKLYEKHAVFQSSSGKALVASQLKENNHDLKVYDEQKLPEYGPELQRMSIDAIFGFYSLLSGSYAALITDSEPFVSIQSDMINIRRVKNILMIPLFKNNRILSESKQRDEDEYLHLLQMAFSKHNFFFSTSFDVTLTQQKQAILFNSKKDKDPIWSRADHRFFWNRDVVADLIACEADEWIVPVMSAYIELRPSIEIENKQYTILFISRRSCYRQGCRFTKRGIDEHGHVANFAETEQILIHNDVFLEDVHKVKRYKLTSYVQVRGSIPVVWTSPVTMKYEPPVHISEDKNASIQYAEKHVTDLRNQYADNSSNVSTSVIFVNLVDNKKDQGKLGAAYHDVIDEIKKLRPSYELKYVWFDFHAETARKGKWNNLRKLFTEDNGVSDMFERQGYFCKDASGVVSQWQRGIVRTNCMDNLDRTNVVQSLFARRSLVFQIDKGKVVDINDKHVLTTPYDSFEKIYKSIWANNADAISMMYAGTGALKVDFTKTGKRTLKGQFNDGVNSCKRYYINNFLDGVKQDAIDLMIGKYVPEYNQPSPFGARPGQESISINLLKAFVALVIIFSTTLLLGPYLNVDQVKALLSGGRPEFAINQHHIDNLRSHLLISLAVTWVIGMFTVYTIVKKGSKIGERMVIHPRLCT